MGTNTVIANLLTKWLNDDEELTSLIESHEGWQEYAQGDLMEINTLNSQPLFRQEEKPTDGGDDDFGGFNTGLLSQTPRNDDEEEEDDDDLERDEKNPVDTDDKDDRFGHLERADDVDTSSEEEEEEESEEKSTFHDNTFWAQSPQYSIEDLLNEFNN